MRPCRHSAPRRRDLPPDALPGGRYSGHQSAGIVSHILDIAVIAVYFFLNAPKCLVLCAFYQRKSCLNKWICYIGLKFDSGVYLSDPTVGI